jgi:hypothetical protein
LAGRRCDIGDDQVVAEPVEQAGRVEDGSGLVGSRVDEEAELKRASVVEAIGRGLRAALGPSWVIELT